MHRRLKRVRSAIKDASNKRRMPAKYYRFWRLARGGFEFRTVMFSDTLVMLPMTIDFSRVRSPR